MKQASPFAALAFNNVGHSFNHLMMLLYPTAVLGMGASFGAAYADLIELAAPGLVLYGVAALPAGWLGDRWSQIGMMGVGFLGTGAGALVVAFAETTTQIMLGLSLLGLFAAIYHPVGIAWLIATAKNHGKALGSNGIFGSIGVASGPLLAGALTDWFGWRAAFLVPGVTSLALGVAFALTMRHGVEAPAPVQRETRTGEGEPNAPRALMVLAATVICTGFVYSAASVAMPKIFSERLGDWGASAVGVGLIVSAVYVTTAFMQVLGGWLADRYSKKWVYALCQAALVPMVLIAAASFGPVVIVFVFFMLACNVAGTPVENALIASWAPERWRSVVYGMKFVLTLGVSGLLVPPVIATFDRLHGRIDMLLYVIAGCGLAAAAIAALFLPAERRTVSIAAPEAAE